MSWRTNKLVRVLRDAGRSAGLNRAISAFRRDGYEERFQSLMLGAIHEGDSVWDVGANVGLYSVIFAERVGANGHVIAFEPSEVNRSRLADAVNGYPTITIVPMALGEAEGTVVFQQGADALGATSRILAEGAEGGTKIRVIRGDDAISREKLPVPNVIKIDTEGYELEVLRGLPRTLASTTVRTLCIEVHFGILKERGMDNAPREIEALLTDAGFDLSWADPSHMVATRVR